MSTTKPRKRKTAVSEIRLEAVPDVYDSAPVSNEAAKAEFVKPAPTRFRVELPGCKVRVDDPEKGFAIQDHLDVDASNEGEAWMKFRDYNGIRASDKQPLITPID